MARLQSKSFDKPDQVRSIAHGNVRILDLGDIVVGRMVWEPGWRWSEHVKSIAKTELKGLTGVRSIYALDGAQSAQVQGG